MRLKTWISYFFSFYLVFLSSFYEPDFSNLRIDWNQTFRFFIVSLFLILAANILGKHIAENSTIIIDIKNRILVNFDTLTKTKTKIEILEIFKKDNNKYTYELIHALTEHEQYQNFSKFLSLNDIKKSIENNTIIKVLISKNYSKKTIKNINNRLKSQEAIKKFQKFNTMYNKFETKTKLEDNKNLTLLFKIGVFLIPLFSLFIKDFLSNPNVIYILILYTSIIIYFIATIKDTIDELYYEYEHTNNILNDIK